MALLEHEHGITSTYYFKKTKNIFLPSLIKDIAELGHEIGYHYEVLDKAKGDIKKAIRIFEQELSEFRAIVDVKTICMHGNPLSSWSNKDLWHKYDFRDFGIIGEPYLSIEYNKVLYLSDTGRTWSGRYNVKDVVNSKFCYAKCTDDVINLIKKRDIPRLCLLVHPNRWADGFSTWLVEFGGQNIKNIGKVGIIRWRNFFKEVS
jgi:hypothetical protein